MHFSPFMRRALLISLPVFALAGISISWTGTGAAYASSANVYSADTIPSKNNRNGNIERQQKGIDYHLDQLDTALEKLNRQLQETDFQKLQQNVQEAINKIDVDKIQQDINDALKSIDVEKIRQEIKKIDFEKIRQEIRQELKKANSDINLKEVQKELQQAMKEVEKSIEEVRKTDFEKIRKELSVTSKEWQKEKAKIQQELARAKEEMKRERVELKKELESARDEIKRSKANLQDYKTMITQMESDGLIDSKEDYTIDYRNNELMINGKKQSAEILQKYKSYLKGDLHIKKDKDDFNVNSKDR